MKRRTAADLLGEDPTPTEADKAIAIIRARADAVGDMDGHTMNGFAFAEHYEGRYLYIPETKAWVHYNGVVWAPIDIGVIMQGFAVSREGEARAQNELLQNDATKAQLRHAARLLHRLEDQEKALRAASQHPKMRKSLAEFDQQPYLLAVKNGVLDLRKGALVRARSRQYLMRQAPVEFDPSADCPTFRAYLRKVQPDREVRRFLQRFTGYTLTGDVTEEKFLFLHGEAATGKSAYCACISALLGSFVVNIASSALTANKYAIDHERVHARLPGARLALSNETREGTVWNEVLIKELSGHDRASARLLYQNAVDYKPTHKLWIRGNHVPGSFDSSDGLARRYTPVAFNVIIPPENRDLKLVERITTTELSGLLNWALEGAVNWYADRERGCDGLGIPDSILREREEYKSESDWFGQWLTERVIADATAETPTSELFDDYRLFCLAANMRPLSLIGFGRTMTKRGFKRLKANHGKRPRYRGAKLAAAGDERFR
jgi:P4 family phage/plasmid primase-like protien